MLGPPPGTVLEVAFAGIHAEPLRLAGFEVVVVEPDPAQRVRARERGSEALAVPPEAVFDAAVAPEGVDLTGVRAARVLRVARDGSVAEER